MSTNFVNTLISLSEKAANLSRICRQDEHLLSLLVREKLGDDKNPRFFRDFKTLADVLVQEVVKHELETNWPSLINKIYGEESNQFQIEDETVAVEVKDTQDETEALLMKVLGDEIVASLLAAEVHRPLTAASDVTSDICLPNNIAVWIDPIDSTTEYINGGLGETANGLGIKCNGVSCVTVLIGVFNADTGSPVIGVVNQPFHQCVEKVWVGQYFYGIFLESSKQFGPRSIEDSDSQVIVTSRFEREDVKGCLTAGGYHLVEVAGAGYKCLSVIQGEACAYVLSKGSIYPWDICACDAVLRAKGGAIVDFITKQPLKYSDAPVLNSGGIIAYNNVETFNRICSLLSESL